MHLEADQVVAAGTAPTPGPTPLAPPQPDNGPAAIPPVGPAPSAPAPAPSADALAHPGCPWHLGERLRRGALGEVFRARHKEQQEREACVEVVVDPQLIGRVRSGQRRPVRIRHPRAMQLISYHPEADPPYVVWEPFSGKSLEETGALAAPRALHVLEMVLETLDAANHAGTIHGALSTSYVLLDANGDMRLADFRGLPEARKKGDTDRVPLQDVIMLVGGERGSRASDAPPERVRSLTDSAALSGRDPSQTTRVHRRLLGAAAQRDLRAAGALFIEMITGREPRGDEVPSRAAGVAGDLGEHIDRVHRRLRTAGNGGYESVREAMLDVEMARRAIGALPPIARSEGGGATAATSQPATGARAPGESFADRRRALDDLAMRGGSEPARPPSRSRLVRGLAVLALLGTSLILAWGEVSDARQREQSAQRRSLLECPGTEEIGPEVQDMLLEDVRRRVSRAEVGAALVSLQLAAQRSEPVRAGLRDGEIVFDPNAYLAIRKESNDRAARLYRQIAGAP